MAGHSKWANIKHRKAAQDAKRGKLFTKFIRELTVSAREGGSDPDSNPRLRIAIDKALGGNMTRDTIERAIKRGAGELEGQQLETIIYEGRKFKSYRGMGSIGAMNEGSSDRYFQGNTTDSKKFVPEGIEGRVPYKGKLKEIIHQHMGGLRSCMGLTGCATIQELNEKAQFVKVTSAGMGESHVHDVTITKEAPNYRVG